MGEVTDIVEDESNRWRENLSSSGVTGGQTPLQDAGGKI